MNIFKLTFILLIIFILIFIINLWKNLKSHKNQIIKENSEKNSDIQYWVDLIYEITYPIFNALSKGIKTINAC